MEAAETELIEDLASVAELNTVQQDTDTAADFNGYTCILNFDPDSDGFVFDLPLARQLHRNMNLLEFIRKRILNNKAKHFDQNVKALAAHLSSKPSDSEVSTGAPWDDCKKYDKALLRAYSDHGSKLFVDKFNQAHGDSLANGTILTDDWAKARIERVCEFFRDVATISKDNNR